MIEFAVPYAFLLLLAPVLVFWLAPPYREAKSSVQVPFFRALADLSGETPRAGAVILQRSLAQRILLPLAWLLLVVALARPELVGAPLERTKSARDLMIAADLSGSMSTADFVTETGETINRWQAVKQVLRDFVARRSHDRLGLIVFGDAAYLQAPFTADHEAWLTLLDEAEIGMAGQSTKFGDAIGLAIKLFEKSETENRVLIVLTDGNDTASRVPPVDAARVAAAKGIKIYPIAIGDPATIGEEAIDIATLERVSSETGGAFFQALDRDELEGIYGEIMRLEPEQYETIVHQPRTSLHHYPLAGLLVALLLMWLAKTLGAINRRRRANA